MEVSILYNICKYIKSRGEFTIAPPLGFKLKNKQTIYYIKKLINLSNKNFNNPNKLF